MTKKLRIASFTALLIAAAAMAQTPATSTAPATQAANRPTWIRITTVDNSVGATAALTVQTVNLLTGTTITQLDSGDNLRLTYQDPATQEYLDYTAAAKELRKADLSPGLRGNMIAFSKSLPQALTITASVARWKNALADNWVDVTPVEENGIKRYDFSAKNPNLAAVPRRRRNMPVPDVVLVDAKTDLVSKTIIKLNDGTRQWENTVTYEYDIPGPADIYDAGVPRDAKIVDNRPSKDARELLDRIEARVSKSFGNYVGVHIDSLMQSEGEVEAYRSVVRLIAHKDNTALAETFAVMPEAVAGRPGIALPEKWQQMDAGEFLKLVRASTPHSFIAIDANKVSSGRFLRGRFIPPVEQTIEPGTARSLASIASYVWPATGSIPRYTPETQIRLIKDVAHPGLLGLEVNNLGPSNDFYKSQTVYWIDPEKDDILMESIETVFKGGSALNRLSSQETRTTETAKLADGRWYPTRWTISFRKPSTEGFLDASMQRECRLMLFDAKEFQPDWVPSTQPASSTQPAATATAPGSRPNLK